jgi:hypothetical protein
MGQYVLANISFYLFIYLNILFFMQILTWVFGGYIFVM